MVDQPMSSDGLGLLGLITVLVLPLLAMISAYFSLVPISSQIQIQNQNKTKHLNDIDGRYRCQMRAREIKPSHQGMRYTHHQVIHSLCYALVMLMHHSLSAFTIISHAILAMYIST
jgi:hypothetical protein